MFLQIYVYSGHLYWNANLATQEGDVASEGIIYKHSIGCVERLKSSYNGGVQLTYNFPKPSFTIYKEYLSEIKDMVNDVTYTGNDIDTDEKIITIFNNLA